MHDVGMLGAELDDNRMHPALSAPRCLPCGYEDPLQNNTTINEFQAPKVASLLAFACMIFVHAVHELVGSCEYSCCQVSALSIAKPDVTEAIRVMFSCLTFTDKHPCHVIQQQSSRQAQPDFTST